MQYGACSMWLPVTSGTQMWQPTRLDSTRLDFAPNCVPLSMACRLVAWGTCSLLQRCLLPACCLFCLLKCRKCCGSQQAMARDTRAGKQRCNWQLPQMVASNKCCQHVGTHICALYALLCSAGIALAFAVWQLLTELLHLPLGLRLLLRVQQSDSCSTTPTACRNNHVQLSSINCLFP